MSWFYARAASGFAFTLVLTSSAFAQSANTHESGFASPGHGSDEEAAGPYLDKATSGAPLEASTDQPPNNEPESRPSGAVLPVGRLAFGALATLSPGSGSFAFDITAGLRGFFLNGNWHPSLAAEFGYTRRGESIDTHDLMLTVAFGVTSAEVGFYIAESLLFPVGSETRPIGLRSAIRLTTFIDIYGLEVAHGMEFASDRHELRFTVFMDIGQVIGFLL